MANYLITGGAGFVGSHTSELFLQRGHKVTVLDDLSSGSEKNIEHLRSNPRFEFIRASVADEDVLFDAVDSCDIIYHLAATVGVFNILERPVETITNNIEGTDVVLRAAARQKKKTIVASTSEVYGKSAAPTFMEDGDLVLGASSKSRWCYAASKLVDEFLALAYLKEQQVPTVVVRLFNTIGPRQTGQYGMVVPRFINQALSGQPLTVYGTGSQSRCFTYVADVAEWLYLLGENDKAVGQVLNLGNPEEISIENLALKIIGLTKSSSTIEHVPYEQAYESGFEDMLRRVPNISKVTELTGRQPQVNLEQALIKTRDWFLNQPVVAEAATAQAAL